ncbi:hypothetical protein LCGC14_1245290 [marine sediment metagenome]|uniref:Uncharacterized protein n=1 Tax=marine sediment metagenome TaxID=412755 RepID=A0A0F9LRL7_9ZZZZ
MSEPCNQTNTIKSLIESKGSTEAKLNNIEKCLKDIKDNHLHSIYDKIDNINTKLSVNRPTWTITVIITFLVSLVLLLLREVL